MNAAAETKTATVERDFAYPPEKLWRALTQPHLIAEWLMKNDFALTVGHPFQLRTDPQPNWDGVIDCKVLAIDPNKSLSYRWAALDLESIVTFTLTPTSTGTHMRLVHSGFRPDQPRAFAGATYGWNSFLGKLDQLLARPE